MFHFRKKDKEREEKDKKKVKEKKDKKDNKKPKDRPLTQEELNRLAEVKSSFGVLRSDSKTLDASPAKERPTSLKFPSDSSESSLSPFSPKSPENGVFKGLNTASNKPPPWRLASPTKPTTRPPVPSSKPPVIKSSNLTSKGILKGRTSSLSKTSGIDSVAANTRSNETMMDSHGRTQSSKLHKLSSRSPPVLAADEVDRVKVDDANVLDLHSQGQFVYFNFELVFV